MSGNITKLKWISFLSGFVIWYGIDKLYMTNIGISAAGVAAAVLALQVANVLLDLPTGIVTDMWGRRPVMVLSAASLAAGSLVMGLAGSLPVFLIGVLLYALHIVTLYGTMEVLIADTLDSQGRTEDIGEVTGKVFFWNIIAYAAGAMSGAFWVWLLGGYRPVFLAEVVLALMVVVICLTLREPEFQKLELGTGSVAAKFQQGYRTIWVGSKGILAVGMIRPLLGVMYLTWAVWVFKEGFGQLYFLAFVPEVLGPLTAPMLVSLLFGIFYAVWAWGEHRAGRFKGKIDRLVIMSVVPLLVVCVASGRGWIGTSVAFVAYMVETYYVTILFRQISSEIQAVTPATIRGSATSARTTFGRLASCGYLLVASLFINDIGVTGVLWLVTIPACLAAVVWLVYRVRHPATVEEGTDGEPTSAPRLAAEEL